VKIKGYYLDGYERLHENPVYVLFTLLTVVLNTLLIFVSNRFARYALLAMIVFSFMMAVRAIAGFTEEELVKGTLLLLPVFIVTSLVYGFIVFAGFAFFILPGIYFAARFYFYMYEILADGQEMVSSLRHSWHMTQGHVWQVLLTVIPLTYLGLMANIFVFLLPGDVSTALYLPANAVVLAYQISVGYELYEDLEEMAEQKHMDRFVSSP